MATFNPNLPAHASPLSSAEMRTQLNALNDAQVDQYSALSDRMDSLGNSLDTQIADTARNPRTLSLPTFHDPPTYEDLEAIRAYLNDLLADLQR